MNEMKLFSVSLVFTKVTSSEINNSLNSIILFAGNSDEAFGTAYRILSKEYKNGWSLSLQCVLDATQFAKTITEKPNTQMSDAQSKDEVTIGQIITEAALLHGLNPVVIEEQLGLSTGILQKLMADEYYTNSVPVMLFRNLLALLTIPFKKIEPAMLPTFRLVASKETPDSIKQKPHGYTLWENEEAVIKYTKHLQSIMSTTVK